MSPFGVRKSQTKGGGYDIVKKLPSGGTKKVGHSKTKKKALASIRAREAGSPENKKDKKG